MGKQRHGKETPGEFFPQEIQENRRRTERRRQPANGFARISTVGWICRRERLRRMRDPGHSNDSEK